MNDNLTAEERKRLDQFYLHVVDYFEGDCSKATLWFNTINPMLGDITPNEMITRGRLDKMLNVFKHVEELYGE